jgi:hypothetical protein
LPCSWTHHRPRAGRKNGLRKCDIAGLQMTWMGRRPAKRPRWKLLFQGVLFHFSDNGGQRCQSLT